MQIAPGVHAIRVMSGYVYALLDGDVTLVDAGLIGSGRAIERGLGRLGHPLADVARIICTHAHPDHIGAVKEIAGDREVDVMMHPADLATLSVSLRDAVANRNRHQLIAYFTRHPGEASPLEDGQLLPILGGLRVIHTPGHTPGSICLYLERERMLFTGDALQVIRGKITFASSVFSDDLPQAKRSVALMAELDVETIAFAHYPPWRRDARGTLEALAARA